MEPMFVDGPPILGLLLALSAVGMVVGFIWLHRISGLDADPGRSIFRYREPGTFRRLAELFDLVPSLPLPSVPVLPLAIRRRLTIRWLMTRVELAMGVVAVAVAASPLWLTAHRSSPMILGPDWSTILAIAGTVGTIVGLVWMIRIARRPAEAGQTIWRSLQD